MGFNSGFKGLIDYVIDFKCHCVGRDTVRQGTVQHSVR